MLHEGWGVYLERLQQRLTGQRGIVAFPVSKEGHGGSRQGGTLSKPPVGIMEGDGVHVSPDTDASLG